MSDIAVFDFDGTISRHDSLGLLLRWRFSLPRLVRGSLKVAPRLAAWRLGFGSNQAAKEAVLAEFFGGLPEREMEGHAKAFAAEVLPGDVRPEARDRIEWHRQRGDRLILASSSLVEYLGPWAATAGFQNVVASRLEVVAGRVTGGLEGANCYGEEKLRRVLEVLGHGPRGELWVYGNSRGDRELAEAADHVGWRSFDAVRKAGLPSKGRTAESRAPADRGWRSP